jgi:hypothetical protein
MDWLGTIAAHPWAVALVATLGTALIAAGTVAWSRAGHAHRLRYSIVRHQPGAMRLSRPGRPENESITRDYSLTELCLWNAGIRTVQPSDVHREQPLRLTLLGSDLLWARVSPTSSPGAGVQLDPGSLVISFERLRQGDAVRFEVLHTSADINALMLAGRLESGPAGKQDTYQPVTPLKPRTHALLVLSAFVLVMLIQHIAAGSPGWSAGAVAGYLGLLCLIAIAYGALIAIVSGERSISALVEFLT